MKKGRPACTLGLTYYLGIATMSARGHSCPQERAMGKMAWEVARPRWASELAADRNVRAPVGQPRRARPPPAAQL
jgi:hypothetical protein